YDWIAAAPRFSNNERRLVYVAERFSGIAGREQFIVLDGMEGKPYGWIRGDVRFNPDGNRVAYMATPIDPRFDSAEEVPYDPRNPSLGTKLVLDKSIDSRGMTPAELGKPIDLRVVEERIVKE
ncbi:MAG TPA: hypothetical protein VFC46_08835, partial [Humisphaera sp.]|nr:hypothetical protein [Humisphaera sp.]